MDTFEVPNGCSSQKFKFLSRLATVGYVKPLECILTNVKIKFRFSIFCLSNRLNRRSEVTVGSEDPLQFFFSQRAYLFKRGQVEHILTIANLKLKPTLFMPRPSRQ